jgi:uncharacterized membrane protein HdeD (DUF308 family)
MDDRVSVSWWSLVLRGIVAIAFGVLAFIFPTMALWALVLLFGAYSLVDGIFAIVSGARPHGEQRRDWLLVLGGVAGVVVGLIAFFLPGLTAIALVYLIGAWAVVTGAFEVAATIELRRRLRHAWLYAVDGIVSVLFGFVVLIAPGAGAFALIWLIAAYAIASGVLLIAFGLRLRSESPSTHRMDRVSGSPAHLGG